MNDTLRCNTYKTCLECGKPHYHQMDVLTDMMKVISGELDSYTIEFICHGCGESYLGTRTIPQKRGNLNEEQQPTYDENQRNSRKLNAQHEYVPERNEVYFCPGCNQGIALHPDTMPPGENCKLGKGEDGLDPDDYRQERHDDTWQEYEDDHNAV